MEMEHFFSARNAGFAMRAKNGRKNASRGAARTKVATLKLLGTLLKIESYENYLVQILVFQDSHFMVYSKNQRSN